MIDIKSIFSSDGALARNFPEFRERPQQLEMAEVIADTITNQQVLVAEAGTGTGKTLAYLIPALLAGGKVIISTGTKTLQDQLFYRDIPTARKAINIPVTVALLKGRNNYICHYHLEKCLQDSRMSFDSREEAAYLPIIERFAQNSVSGDKSELNVVPEHAAIWQHVTSTRESCLGSECPSYKKCFVMEARKQALLAEIVVVNHHLFFADVMLRDEGLSELLPACNTVIFDEAHQLPDTASLFFGESISTAQLLDLIRDTLAESIRSAADFTELPAALAKLEKSVRDLRLAVTGENTRLSWQTVQNNSEFQTTLRHLIDQQTNTLKLLENQAERSEGLENCRQRAAQHLYLLERWCNDSEMRDHIRWLEVFHHALQLNATPLSIAEIFKRQMISTPRAWIFTSATLSIKSDFSHYNHEMGLSEVRTATWDSPFDFSEQALLYVPSGLPEPSHPNYIDQLVQAALPVLHASQGRAFFLCTSLRAMQRVHEILSSIESLPFPLFLQGQGSRPHLLERFRATDNAILIGSQSFWEGVDIKGEALSLVIIDKLPFASPDDPVLSARIEKINQAGRNAFMEYQLPHAIIQLKQGAGRLIRGESDRGVLMICDPRLITKTYGKKIWQSLPPMKRTRNLQDVVQFFHAIETKEQLSGT